MFEEKSELYPFLARSGLTAFTETIEPLCVPSICFEETSPSTRKGGSRLGGGPDLPGEIEWPRRAAYGASMPKERSTSSCARMT